MKVLCKFCGLHTSTVNELKSGNFHVIAFSRQPECLTRHHQKISRTGNLTLFSLNHPSVLTFDHVFSCKFAYLPPLARLRLVEVVVFLLLFRRSVSCSQAVSLFTCRGMSFLRGRRGTKPVPAANGQRTLASWSGACTAVSTNTCAPRWRSKTAFHRGRLIWRAQPLAGGRQCEQRAKKAAAESDAPPHAFSGAAGPWRYAGSLFGSVLASRPLPARPRPSPLSRSRPAKKLVTHATGRLGALVGGD